MASFHVPKYGGAFWRIGSRIVGGHGSNNSGGHEFESPAWATLVGYKRQYTWLAADPTFSRSKLYSGALPGETVARHNLRTGVRGAQCEYAAFLGLNLSPTLAMQDTHIRSIRTDHGKDIVVPWKGRRLTVDVKGIARPGTRDESFGPLDPRYRGVPHPPEGRGYCPLPKSEPALRLNRLFMPMWQLAKPADVYVQVMHEPNPACPDRSDGFVCTFIGACPAVLMRPSQRGRTEGMEAPRMMELEEAFDLVSALADN